MDRRKFLKYSSLALASVSVEGTGISGFNLKPGVEDQKIKNYRIFGRTGFSVSDIGCGPVEIRDEGLLKSILLSGVNIIDTSEYYSNGNNERMVGRAIRQFDRSKLFLCTKFDIGLNESKSSIITRVNNCLERLQTPYIDCLISSSVNYSRIIKKEAFHSAITQLKKDNKVRFCGAACHGSSWASGYAESMEQVLMSAVNDGRYDVLLMVYNFVQRDMAEKVLEACAKKNIGTLAMKTEPFGSYYLKLKNKIDNKLYSTGGLSREEQQTYNMYMKLHEDAKPFLQKYGLIEEEAIRDASIRFVLDNPGMHSTLISFRDYESAGEYIGLSGSRLSNTELSLIEDYSGSFSKYYCRHACGICEKACPDSVPVNTIMRYNHYSLAQNRISHANELYRTLQGNKAGQCAECEGFCEKACPYGVRIKNLLGLAHLNMSS